MPSKQVILDSNVWISLFLTDRYANLVQVAVANSITFLSSPVLLAELADVIGRKKFERYLTSPQKDYLDFHLNLVEMRVTTPIFDQSPDPKDNYLFDLAIQSGCNLIVTGDKKLLAVNPLADVRVISLANFWAEL